MFGEKCKYKLFWFYQNRKLNLYYSTMKIAWGIFVVKYYLFRHFRNFKIL